MVSIRRLNNYFISEEIEYSAIEYKGGEIGIDGLKP